MAVTHADLAPSPPKTDLSSKTGLVIMVCSIILGLNCFILSLIAEATRSEVSWMAKNGGGDGKYECTYSGSGKTPLMSAAGAFLSLALAMVLEHSYLLIAVSKSPTASLAYWDPDSDFVKSLTWQAGFFFVATWISFAVGEILLLIGLSVESGHLTKWKTPKPSCLVIGQGVFSAAGVFGLLTVFMAAGLYISALRGQRFLQDQENIHHNAIEASVLYASPPRSPRRIIRPVADENPVARQDRNEHISLGQYTSELEKYLYLV
nr:L-threonine 3-dehydrogenase [Ipomoea batatas]